MAGTEADAAAAGADAAAIGAAVGIEPRIKEAVRLGFTKLVIPANRTELKSCIQAAEGADVIPVKSLFELLASKKILAASSANDHFTSSDDE